MVGSTTIVSQMVLSNETSGLGVRGESVDLSRTSKGIRRHEEARVVGARRSKGCVVFQLPKKKDRKKATR